MEPVTCPAAPQNVIFNTSSGTVNGNRVKRFRLTPLRHGGRHPAIPQSATGTGRTLIRRAAWLYPASWRVRYGDEFEALMDDLEPGWPEFFDVCGGAIKMQLLRR